MGFTLDFERIHKMIYAFNFTCFRDEELSDLMTTTLRAHCKNVPYVVVVNTDIQGQYSGYGNGAGWPQGLLKVKYIREYLAVTPEISNDDFILSIDSDVIFTSPEVFKYIDPKYGIIGTQHQQPYNSEFGPFGHMSGAMILLRGDIARKIAGLNERELDHLRHNHFKKHNITENEDVMLSYFAKYVGAESFDLGSVPNLTSGNFESDLTNGELKSFYHLNYCPQTFLGEQMNGAKWHIPKVLKMKGIEL